MTTAFDFDRLLASVLEERGAHTAPPATLEVALGLARQTHQRRPVFRALDRQAWPAGPSVIANRSVRPIVALGLVALLLLVVIAAAIFIGSRLRVPPVVPTTTLPGAWVATEGMSAPSEYSSAATLADGRILILGGQSSAQLYDPRTGEFVSTTGAMAGSAELGSATTLRDGRILVITDESAQVFDPDTLRFTPTAPMAVVRTLHTATLLADGRVLVAGGRTQMETDNAEVFDPAANTWSTVGRMSTPRAQHAATLLRDGHVLITGGANETGSGFPTASVELFDPASGTFSVVSPMSEGRVAHTSTLLVDGRVLVAGGIGDSNEAGVLLRAELYDPNDGSFAPTGGLVTERYEHSAVLLADGRVLVVGGTSMHGNPLSAEFYDPATGAFSAGALAFGPHHGPAQLMADGGVLVVGGPPEVFQPPAVTVIAATPGPQTQFIATGGPLEDRSGHAATKLLDGRVLVVGGHSPEGEEGTLKSAEIYDPAAGTFSVAGSMAFARGSPSEPPRTIALFLLPDGRAAVFGGTRYEWDVEIFDPATGQFGSGLSIAREAGIIKHSATAVLLADGRILAFGPPAGSTGDASDWSATGAYVFRPEDPAAVRVGDIPNCSGVTHAASLRDGRVLASCQGGAGLVLFDTRTGESTQIASAASGTGPMLSLPDGRVLLGDGVGTSETVVFDPATGQLQGSGARSSGGGTLTLLPDGRVLIVGESTAATWDPATGTASPLPPPLTALHDHTTTLLDDGRVLIVGGTTWPPDRGTPRPPGAELLDVPSQP